MDLLQTTFLPSVVYYHKGVGGGGGWVVGIGQDEYKGRAMSQLLLLAPLQKARYTAGDSLRACCGRPRGISDHCELLK